MEDIMNKYTFSIAVILCLFLFSATQIVAAPKGLIIDQVEKTFTQEVFYELYTDNEIWDNPEKRKNVFLSTNLAKLEKAANNIGQPPKIERIKMYIQGEMFRVDSENEEGKMTFILRNDLGMMYQIIWPQNLFIKMSKEEIDNMRKGAMNMAKQMKENMPPDIEKMLESLPEPQRKQALEAMKAAGQGYPGMNREKERPSIKDMHKSKDFPDFPNCREFRVVDGEKHIAMWAYGGKPQIANMFHTFSEKFKNTLEMEDEDVDPAELLPKNMFPVFIVFYNESLYGGNMDFKTSLIDKIEQTNISLEVFEAYKDPKLNEGSVQDMMNR